VRVTRARTAIAVIVGALLLTLASTLVPRSRLEVQDWDCPPAPASCARPVEVRGLPLPWISDFHGISPVGGVDVVGALLGMDIFHAGAFVADVALFALLLAIAAGAGTRLALRSREMAGDDDRTSSRTDGGLTG
jgi:hypothetical protein